MRHNKIREHYAPRICAGDPGWKMLDWASEEGQRLRFEALVKTLRGGWGHPPSILDVGCGTADLFAYLQNEMPGIRYTGVDLLEEIVAEARRRHPGAEVLQGDVFKENVFPPRSFDVVFCSGVFNLELGNNEAFAEHALPVLRALARRVVVVNFLHARAENKFEGCHYYTPEKIVALCARLAPVVELDEGYLESDFTVVMFLGSSNGRE